MHDDLTERVIQSIAKTQHLPVESIAIDNTFAELKFDSLDGITPNTQYLGDASKSNWVSSGEPKVYEDGNGKQVLLTMPEHSVGTLLASTSYVWYGNIKATMKTRNSPNRMAVSRKFIVPNSEEMGERVFC